MTSTMPATTFADTEITVPSPWTYLSVAVLGRAGAVALCLGTVLTLVNQFDAIFGAEALQVLSLLLVYATPFAVVTISQALGIQRAVQDARDGVRSDPTLLSTALNHGIPLRALTLGLLAGAINTAFVLGTALPHLGDPGAVPWTSLAQAFILPVLFGIFSQAIAYRRASS